MPAVFSSVTPHCIHFNAFTLNYLQVPNSYKGVNILLISIFNSSTSLVIRHSFLRDLHIIYAIMNYTTYCLNCKILSLNFTELRYDGQNIQTYENFCMERII